MTSATIRQEIIQRIEAIPDRGLYALKPLLDVLADIDDDLTDEERELGLKTLEEYRRDPSAFVDLDDIP
ncbi:MAG: hypothetical protein LBO72_08845 [Helicobacteraceae bacterium]|jgi:hypothetical protein|nr:hypothetical protein [Helicobacteraceae bacterium]